MTMNKKISIRLLPLTLLLFVLQACDSGKKTPTDPNIYYTCSMDPQVVSDKPGICPICKMDLTPVTKKVGEKQDELELSDQQVQLGNIQFDTIKNGTIKDEMVLTATLNFDQSKVRSVSAWVMGRVEKLYYKNLGDYVKKGAPLFDLYSEELNNAKQEYLLALDKKKLFAADAVIDFDQLVQSAKNKLLLWGLTESQISELVKAGKIKPVTTFYSTGNGYITELNVQEGDYVMEGGSIVRLADLSGLWAEAQVYTSQLAEVNKSSMAMVRFPGFAEKEIQGKIEFVNPEINPDMRINLLRVAVPNPGNELKPGMPAYVVLKSPQRNSLTLPVDAVIRNGKTASAWIQAGKNTFKAVMVETGVESDDRIEIKAGLKEGDIVVLSGAYLLHSEYVFKKGTNPMAGHDH